MKNVTVLQSTFKTESSKLQEQLAREKSIFEGRLVKMTEKLGSFEGIVRKATQTQQKMKESKYALKSELQQAKMQIRSLQENNHFPMMRSSEEESVHEYQFLLRDAREQLEAERKGAENRVEELLILTR